MLFCSAVFLIFFIVYLLFWYCIPKKEHRWVIIFGSLYFYGYWNWNFLFIPVGLTLASYLGIKWIENTDTPTQKRVRLATCIVGILIPLFIFKYLNFFLQREVLSTGIPLGISYITFTLVAYLIDVSKGEYSAEDRFSWLLAYVTYFPQLIAGPILRPKELLPQLKKNLSPTGIVRWQALTIFTIGLSKKLIFADQIKPVVDGIYQTTGTLTPLKALMGYYLFPAQIYCDFSGYTDMAIGLALFFGIQFPINFNRPLLSKSTTEFWRRWQMTLSFWFRDYLYIPIVKRYPHRYIKHFAKFITLVLCGLWHGANWTFVVWGAYNGALLVIEIMFKNTRWPNIIPKPIKIFVTFHLLAAGMILFRAQDMSQAVAIIKSIFCWQHFTFSNISTYAYSLALCSVVYLLHRWDFLDFVKDSVVRSNKFLLSAILSALWFFSIILNVLGGGSSKFIYFDF